jgi:hypothetical protein
LSIETTYARGLLKALFPSVQQTGGSKRQLNLFSQEKEDAIDTPRVSRQKTKT